MSYAITIGTVSATWIDQNPTPQGCVRFDGALPANPIWDGTLQNIREMTQAEIDALPALQAVAAHPALVAALSGLTASQEIKLLRSLVLTALDEFNRHTTLEAAIFSATAAATSLGDLKTRFAAISQIPQRSKADLLNAMIAHINAGDADS